MDAFVIERAAVVEQHLLRIETHRRPKQSASEISLSGMITTSLSQ